MPGEFLTDAERESFQSFPQELHPQDVIAYFTLSQADLTQIPSRSSPPNRLGFAMLLCALRYLGFCPSELSQAPSTVIAYVADQLELTPQVLELYGQRPQTRTSHFQQVCSYLGYRPPNDELLAGLKTWLLQRALEHNRPALLLQMLCEKCHDEKIVRPGITSLERMVSAARVQASEETFLRLSSLLTEPRKELLDNLLLPESSTGITVGFLPHRGL